MIVRSARVAMIAGVLLSLAVLVGCGAGIGPTIPSAPDRGLDGGEGGSGGGGGSGGVPEVGLIQPSDLEYLGAFRLPGPSGGSDWTYSGDGLAYFPQGDPDGPDDGFPGSLFGVGHDWHKQVCEISIPTPVISPDKSPDALDTAQTLRPFRDVRAGVGQLDRLTEMVRVGIEYLPAEGAQGSGKLFLCFGQHFQEDEELDVPSHMACETDLSGARGAWRVGEASPYSVNDYLFEIPAAWAAANTPGLRLATGRFRDGGWGGQGPNLFAIGLGSRGSLPADGARLNATVLLHYSSTATDPEPWHLMDEYHHSDEWAGGAWLTASDRAAVVFVGTKGTGECWYGLPDGTRWEQPYPADPEGQRGWWSSGFVGQMLFYDPSDLAAVARGDRQPWEPQPYARLDLDPELFRAMGPQQKQHVGDCAFDRERGRLFVMEPLADGDKSIVHVWQVQ